MKRQGALILAISTKADYLFFDETFDGLDPERPRAAAPDDTTLM
jgi:ABC-type multidrug transport system ATPase subunit